MPAQIAVSNTPPADGSRTSTPRPKRRKRSFATRVAELYRYRHLLRMLVGSELKLRYRRSALGFLWSLLNPLLMMSVLSVVFSIIMRFEVKDYALMLLSGLLPWTFISQAVNNSLMSLVTKGSLIHKVYVPKGVFPIATVLANLVNFVLSLIPLLVIGLAIGHRFSLALLFLPVAILLVAVLACGLALLFSCLNVFFRDFTHMTEVLLQALFYASPIIYGIEMVPERFRPFFQLNPLSSIIECFRAPIYRGVLPTWSDLGVATATSLCILLIGSTVFLANEDQFVFRV